MLRNKLINFLQWNDRNGCYTDTNCNIEGLEPLTLEEAFKRFIGALTDDMENWESIDITKALEENILIEKAIELLSESDTVKTYKKIIHLIQ